MPKLDLVRNHALVFSLHADFPTGGAKFDEAFRQVATRYHKKAFVDFTETYSRRRKLHAVSLRLGQLRNGLYHFHLTYDIDVETVQDIKAQNTAPKLEVAFELLSMFSAVSDMQAQAMFAYEASKFYTTMRLPIRFSPVGMSDGQFDEIRGVRTVKYSSGDKLRYTVIVDYPTLDLLNTNVMYSYAGKINEETVELAFESGVEISERFVQPLRTPQ